MFFYYKEKTPIRQAGMIAEFTAWASLKSRRSVGPLQMPTQSWGLLHFSSVILLVLSSPVCCPWSQAGFPCEIKKAASSSEGFHLFVHTQKGDRERESVLILTFHSDSDRLIVKMAPILHLSLKPCSLKWELIVPLIIKYSLFLQPLSLDWPHHLLWPIEHSGSQGACSEPRPQKNRTFSLSAVILSLP